MSSQRIKQLEKRVQCLEAKVGAIQTAMNLLVQDDYTKGVSHAIIFEAISNILTATSGSCSADEEVGDE